MTPPSRGRRRDRVGPNIAHALLIDPLDIRWLVIIAAAVSEMCPDTTSLVQQQLAAATSPSTGQVA